MEEKKVISVKLEYIDIADAQEKMDHLLKTIKEVNSLLHEMAGFVDVKVRLISPDGMRSYIPDNQ